MSELTVILKDSDRTYKYDFLIYEKFTVADDDPVICACKEYAKKIFGNHPESIQIKIILEIQE